MTTLLHKNLGYSLLAALMLMALSIPSATRAAETGDLLKSSLVPTIIKVIPAQLPTEPKKEKEVKTPVPAPRNEPKPDVSQPAPSPQATPVPIAVPAPVQPATEASTTASTTPPVAARVTTASVPLSTSSPTPEKSTYIQTPTGLFENRSTFLFSDPTNVYRTNHLGKGLTTGLFGLSTLLLLLAGTLHFLGNRRVRSPQRFTPDFISRTRIAS